MNPNRTNLKSDATSFLFFIMLMCWGWAWDFTNKTGQYLRVGRIKIWLLTAAVVAAIEMAAAWHWSVGAFYFYAALRYIDAGMPTHGVLEAWLLTSTLLLIPVLYKRVSLYVIENTLLITGAVNALDAILNLFGWYPFTPLTALNMSGTPIGFVGQQTLLAPLLVVTLCISASRFLNGGCKRINGVLSVLFLVIIGFCGSSMGFASLAGAGLIFVWFFRGRAAAGVFAFLGAIAAVIGIQIFPKLGDLNGRLIPWNDAGELILKKPELGYGLGSWALFGEHFAKQRQLPPWVQLHNEFLQGAFEFGSIGMAFVVVLLTVLARKINRICQEKRANYLPYASITAALIINMLANFPLHISPHGQIFAFSVFVLLQLGR